MPRRPVLSTLVGLTLAGASLLQAPGGAAVPTRSTGSTGSSESTESTGVWEPRVILSADGVVSRSPDVTVDEAGVATVAFERRRRYVQVVRRSEDGHWSGRTTIGRGTSPQVGADAAGRVTAVWLGADRTLQASRRSLAGTWSKPVDIGSGAFGGFDLVVSPDGSTTVAWVRHVDGARLDERVMSTHRPAGDRWASPERIGSTEDTGSSVDAAADAEGNAVVVYGDGEAGLVAARRDDDGWSRPRRITGPAVEGGHNAFFRVAMDPAGDIVAVWMLVSEEEPGSPQEELRSARRPVDGPWEDPVTVAADPGPYIEVGMDATGRATAVWDTVDGEGWMNAADRDGAAPWTPPTVVAAPVSPYVSETGLALNGDGVALATFDRTYITEPPSFTERSELQAVYRGEDGTWSTPEVLTEQYISARSEAVLPGGDALVVWETNPNSGESRVAARHYAP